MKAARRRRVWRKWYGIVLSHERYVLSTRVVVFEADIISKSVPMSFLNINLAGRNGV